MTGLNSWRIASRALLLNITKQKTTELRNQLARLLKIARVDPSAAIKDDNFQHVLQFARELLPLYQIR